MSTRRSTDPARDGLEHHRDICRSGACAPRRPSGVYPTEPGWWVIVDGDKRAAVEAYEVDGGIRVRWSEPAASKLMLSDTARWVGRMRGEDELEQAQRSEDPGK